MTGAVLNALNIRLDASPSHSSFSTAKRKVLITDSEFSGVIARRWSEWQPRLLDHRHRRSSGKGGTLLGSLNYEQLLGGRRSRLGVAATGPTSGRQSR